MEERREEGRKRKRRKIRFYITLTLLFCIYGVRVNNNFFIHKNMAQIKQDFLGNFVHLKNTKISFYHKNNGKLFKTITYLSRKNALEEFRRFTYKPRKDNKIQHPQARAYYAQLIIQC